MLKIRREVVDQIQETRDVQGLRAQLQAAIELEHATIPAYLTALYSIKPGYNAAASQILLTVVIQEMLHMVIAANVLNAIGGSPQIDKPGFIPVFPGPLPMGIHEGLTVGLEKLTRGLVFNTFMVIEEPETKLNFPVKQPKLAMFDALRREEQPQPEFATIGEFYAAIIQKMEELEAEGQKLLTGKPGRQVVDNTWFPADQLFPIRNLEDARRGLNLIVEQGEGTTQSPREPDKGLAHFYRLAQIVYGRMLVADPSEPTGWSYSGAPVELNPAGIWNLYANAKTVDYPAGSRARYLAEQFNYGYTSLLRALHKAFNSEADPQSKSDTRLRPAIGLMYELKLVAASLVSTPIPDTDLFAAPTFEYAPVNL
ncbi:MAG TPA: ferritin-like protein [Archangium sp.]|uniref:ferritin-like domain-containing protein n=1 Tax=Archangium sp. TaxID=1872627 RepID=UPI002E32C38D|nr:ferritin-like protein [Archangium sp.]HEX5749929.1 ferritin-like protein [Archangium sp.]